MDKLLELLESNARLTDKELAVMLGVTEKEVAHAIKTYEKEGVIKGYHAIYNYENISTDHVTALIEIKVHPKYGLGFDEIAERISAFEEVESLYLMSGAYDLAVTIVGKTFQEIAMFVAKRLSPLESVDSTATHFILKKFKESGVDISDSIKDDRGTISL